MLKKMMVVALILVMGLAVSVVAGEKGKVADVKTGKTTIADSKDIEQKKTAIMKIMSNGQFKAYIQDDEKFCSAFIEDFKTQKNIEHIKPIVEADNYNDPKLQAYFKQCQKAEFHKTVWAETLSQMKSCDEGEDPCGIQYYATKNFKLYKVNIYNNAEKRDQYVLYAEGYKNSIDKYTYGGYSILDLKNCKSGMSVPTEDPFNYEKQVPIENYNGIIKYKGEYYIFDLYKDPAQRLALEKYNKKRGNMNSICEYRKQN